MELTHHEYLGEQVRNQLVYFPTVTRERFRYQGRVTSLIETGKLFADIDMPALDPIEDRVMICGKPRHARRFVRDARCTRLPYLPARRRSGGLCHRAVIRRSLSAVR